MLEALQASEPGRKVEWVVQPELSVKADPELLQVIMENLLGNAWKFSSKIEQSRIEVGVEEQDGRQVYLCAITAPVSIWTT